MRHCGQSPRGFTVWSLLSLTMGEEFFLPLFPLSSSIWLCPWPFSQPMQGRPASVFERGLAGGKRRRWAREMCIPNLIWYMEEGGRFKARGTPCEMGGLFPTPRKHGRVNRLSDRLGNKRDGLDDKGSSCVSEFRLLFRVHCRRKRILAPEKKFIQP